MINVADEYQPFLELYKELGFCLIPLKYRDKRPAIPSWMSYMSRMSTEDEWNMWWNKKRGSSNVGIVTGNISNIAVIDFDDSNSYTQFIDAAPDFSKTFTISTGKGFHIYFRPDIHARTTTFRLNEMTHHLKQEGGYVVAPPSIHPSGREYTIHINEPPQKFYLAGVANVLEVIGAEKDKIQDRKERSVTWASELVTPVPEGQRNTRAAQLCGLLIRKFPTDFDFIMGMMHAWNNKYCDPKMQDWEVEQVVNGEWRRYGPSGTEYV